MQAEGILKIEAPGAVVFAIDKRRILLVLPGLFVDVLIPLDAGYPAGEGGVELGGGADVLRADERNAALSIRKFVDNLI
jgi:hypothetical protein